MSINILYTEEFEKLLKTECEKCEGMYLLHNKSSIKYSRLSQFINIPVIVLSSAVGFLNAVNIIPNQNIILGGVSIVIAILKTLDSYYDWTKRTENHRVTGLKYLSIHNFIKIQLSLEKDCRIKPSDLLEIISKDIQNIKDSEYPITKDIINEFNKQYEKYNVSKPSICNGLSEISINQNSKPQILNATLVKKELNNILVE